MPRKKQELVLREPHVKIFKFIKAFIAENIFAPEQQEIATATDITPRHVARILIELEKMGYVSHQYRKKRSLKIVKELQ